jgi:hypothetical protein
MRWLLLLLAVLVVWYLVTRGRTRKVKPQLIGNIQGAGRFKFDVVGESHYQQALEDIAGPKDDESKQHDCIAELVLDDDNQYDNQAVLVAIDGQKVGHLSRKHAREFRAELKRQGIAVTVCRVPALIVGGWKRGSDEGHFGVKLDLPLDG